MNKTKYLPTKTSYKNCILLTTLFIGVYIIDNSKISSYIDTFIYTYMIKPLIWIFIAMIIWKLPHIRPVSKIKNRKFIYFWAFYFGLFYVLLTIFTGLFFGLGKSPYGHTIKAILTNISLVGSTLIAKEFIRSYLISNITKKENYLIFILISLLMTFFSFPINKYVNLNGLQGYVIFVAEYFAPEFSHSLLATYLVYLGGAWTSIIYLGVIQGFHWLSPILPSLNWITTALIGIMCPIFFLMSFKLIYLNQTKEIKRYKQDEEGLFSWIITCIISVAVIWFSVGVFPIYPSVIATGSMEPMIKPGDVILVEKIKNSDDINTLKINDVIQFKRDSILISHRIIEIINDEKEGILFKTKGDNNSTYDSDLVKPQNIKGTIKKVIPKIGYLTLLIKSNNDIPLDDLVY